MDESGTLHGFNPNRKHLAVSAYGANLTIYDGYFQGDCAHILGGGTAIYGGYFCPTHSDYTVIGRCGALRAIWDSSNDYGQLFRGVTDLDVGEECGGKLHYYSYDNCSTDVKTYLPLEHDVVFGAMSPYGDFTLDYAAPYPDVDGNILYTPGKSIVLEANGFKKYYPIGAPGRNATETAYYIWTVYDLGAEIPGENEDNSVRPTAVYKSTSSTFNYDLLRTRSSAFKMSDGFALTQGHIYDVTCQVQDVYDSSSSPFNVFSISKGTGYRIQYSDFGSASSASISVIRPAYNRVMGRDGKYHSTYTVNYNVSKCVPGKATTLSLTRCSGKPGEYNYYDFVDEDGNPITHSILV